MKPTAATEPAATGRLLSLPQLANELGVSFWTARTWVLNGDIPRVVLPGTNGRTLRRILVDRRDVDQFIEQSKERGV